MSVYSLAFLAVCLFLLIYFILAAPSWTKRLRAPKNLKELIDPNCKKCCGKGYLGTVMDRGPRGEWVRTGKQEICECVGRNYERYQQTKAEGGFRMIEKKLTGFSLKGLARNHG